MRIGKFSQYLLILSILLSSTVNSQQSVWNCWETTYHYNYTTEQTFTDVLTNKEVTIYENEDMQLLDVKIQENNITFRSSYIHRYFLGFQNFNSSEEYDNYLKNVWDFDDETNTSAIIISYLTQKQEICLVDQIGNTYVNFSLPLDIVALVSKMFFGPRLLNGWFLPVKLPEFKVLTDYSAYNNYISSDVAYYSKEYKMKMGSKFLSNGCLINGYKFTLIIEEEKVETNVSEFKMKEEIQLCYSLLGVLYSISVNSQYIYILENINNKITYKEKMVLQLPDDIDIEEGTPLWIIIVGAIGAVSAVGMITFIIRSKIKR
ncbi:MAG: hypothetical protein K9W45_05110 [Candidatus Heimdallarchaeum aukensis]|uniref:Uncharacterized protein n=1 Tax=Candidatus Heimdallarchaeum aukensis TaxID=2876573 RepID=A0A9Y1BMK7_9ARCH|nr:MAG: hypothetical protein K9W45_05110 [Candidatus Heimdallarchaeum aukensis]